MLALLALLAVLALIGVFLWYHSIHAKSKWPACVRERVGVLFRFFFTTRCGVLYGALERPGPLFEDTM